MKLPMHLVLMSLVVMMLALSLANAKEIGTTRQLDPATEVPAEKPKKKPSGSGGGSGGSEGGSSGGGASGDTSGGGASGGTSDGGASESSSGGDASGSSSGGDASGSSSGGDASGSSNGGDASGSSSGGDYSGGSGGSSGSGGTSSSAESSANVAPETAHKGFLGLIGAAAVAGAAVAMAAYRRRSVVTKQHPLQGALSKRINLFSNMVGHHKNAARPNRVAEVEIDDSYRHADEIQMV